MRMRAYGIDPMNVAPHAGAWIETTDVSVKLNTDFVAPHAGAWIETATTGKVMTRIERRSPRGSVD